MHRSAEFDTARAGPDRLGHQEDEYETGFGTERHATHSPVSALQWMHHETGIAGLPFPNDAGGDLAMWENREAQAGMGVDGVDTLVGQKLAGDCYDTAVFVGKKAQLLGSVLDDRAMQRLKLAAVFHRQGPVCRLATPYLLYLFILLDIEV